MKRSVKLFVLIAMTLAAAGCGSLNAFISTQTAMSKVKQGMSRNEVEKLFGNPDLRRFDNDYEEWEFHSDIPGTSSYNKIIIRFTDGKVSTMDSSRIDPPTFRVDEKNQGDI